MVPKLPTFIPSFKTLDKSDPPSSFLPMLSVDVEDGDLPSE